MNKYHNQREEIRDRVKKFSQKSSVIYWIAILNLISFFVILFGRFNNYNLGLALNILFHGLLCKSTLNITTIYILSFLISLVFDAVFVVLSIFVKKGKLKPLIAAFVIYIFDTIVLFFIPQNMFYNGGDNSSLFNILTPYLLHIIVIVYFIYLLISYNNIVKDSLISRQKEQKKEHK